MRILVYGLNYAPEPTGTGKYTAEMAAWLAARGHQVDAITSMPHYPAWRLHPTYVGKGFHSEHIQGVRVLRAPSYIPAPEKLTAGNRIKLETSFSLSALRYWLPVWFARSKYDVVIAVSPPLQIGVFPYVYKTLRRVPWIFHIQDLQVDAAVRLGMMKQGRLVRTLYWIENFLLRNATGVSTITEAMRERIVAKGVPRDRTLLFPNWSDVNTIRPMPKDNSFRSETGAGRDDVLVVYAGNMGEKQGLELVLHAAAAVKTDPRLRFVMIGDGAARHRLETLASRLALPNLTFMPVQPIERLPEMLAAGDIHLVVQKREAADLVMPSKLTNILAAGRPALATAAPGTGLYQVVTEHSTGVVTPPEDVNAFVTALRELARNASLRAKLGYNARAYAERYLDKERILSAFEAQLIGLTAEKRSER